MCTFALGNIKNDTVYGKCSYFNSVIGSNNLRQPMIYTIEYSKEADKTLRK